MIVHNLGICGAKSADVIEKELPQALSIRADLFILMAGCNDLLGNGVTPEQYGANMRRLVTGLTAHAPLVLLSLTPNAEEMKFRQENKPRRHWPEGTAPTTRLRTGNRILVELAGECQVSFCDVFTPFMQYDLNAAESPLINQANSGDPDGTHPTAAGYRIIAARLAETIRSAKLAPHCIVCLGDSITCGAKVAGQGTAEGETYPAFLKQELEGKTDNPT